MLPVGSVPTSPPDGHVYTRCTQSQTTDTEDNLQEERRQQRSDYAAEMNEEEMEQHLSDVMRVQHRRGLAAGRDDGGTHEGEGSRWGRWPHGWKRAPICWREPPRCR